MRVGTLASVYTPTTQHDIGTCLFAVFSGCLLFLMAKIHVKMQPTFAHSAEIIGKKECLNVPRDGWGVERISCEQI